MSSRSFAHGCATQQQLDFEEARKEAFDLWVGCGEVDSMFVGCFTDFCAWTREKERLLSAKECLFLADVGSRRCEYQAAARLYALALQGDPSLVELPEVEAVAEWLSLLEPPVPMEDVLSMDVEKAATVIAAALKQFVTAASLATTHASSEKEMDTAEDLRPVKKPRTVWTLLEMGSYVFEQVQRRGVWGDEYRIQKALYWANACWMYREGRCITSDAPLCFQNGPVYWDVYKAVKAWKTTPGSRPRRADTIKMLLSVLDAAIEHVCCGTWKDVCDETHFETPWQKTGYRAPITEALMREAYANNGTDASPVLVRIFGSLVAPTAAGASSLA